MDARHSTLRLGVVMALCSGCMAGPNYKKPAVPTPSAYRGAAVEPAVTPDVPAKVATFGDAKWWDAFQDDALHDLIRVALHQNYDVRIAAARILEARAQLGIARADQLPGINALASVTNERSPEVAGRPPVETSPAPDHGFIRLGARLLGQVSARHGVGSRQPSGGRVGTASSHQFARQRCGDCLFPVARTGPRTRRSRAGRSRRGETRCG